MGDADASCKFFAVPRGSPGLRPKEKDMENSRIAGSVQDAGLPRILDRAAAVLRTTEKPAFILSAAGMGIFMLMVMLTFADVFLRYLFGSSIPGTTELTELLMVIVVFSSVAVTQWQKSHVTMDILTSRLKEPSRALLEVVTGFWSVVIVLFCAWTTFRYGMKTSSVTLVLRIPLEPFICFAGFGFCMLAVALLTQLLEVMASAIRQNGTARTLLALAAGILCVAAMWYVATHRVPGMSSIKVGVAGLTLLFILFFLGVPVAFALVATGLIFIAQLKGIPASFGTTGKALYATAGSYSWAPLMFFMLMGYLCFYARFGEDIYNCARKWMGHMRGGLAMGSVVACSLFGAVVGDVLSGSIAMAAIALPEMRKNGYDDELAVGTLACSGTIGCLIPPSTTFIIYGVLAQQSIGDLFIAGIIPGIVCMFCFMLAVWLMVCRKPSLAPRLPRASMTERIVSLKSGLPIMLIFLLVIGGIYGGVFTATEGGGIGACGTLILALLMRRLSLKDFIHTLQDSAKYISMCFTVLCGAIVLSYFMAMTRIPMVLANTIAGMDLPGMAVMFAIVMVFLILGCFLPSMPLLLICVPIFVPIAKVFGWDLIWFGVIIVILDNMASITPPFGISLFVMKEVASVSLGTMYRAAVPFVAALLVCLFIIILFPPLSTLLPALMKG